MAHIKKTELGRYKVRYRATDGSEHARTFDRLANARDFAAEKERALRDGELVDRRGGRTLLRDFVAEQPERVRVRESTKLRDAWVRDSLVLPFFSTYRLGRIRPQDVQKFVNHLVAEDYAPYTVKKAYQILGSVMKKAVRAGMLPRTPCEDIELPRDDGEKPRRFLTHEEVARIAADIEPRYRALVLVGAYSGLRPGEVYALRRRHLALPFGKLVVEQTLAEVRGEVVIGPVKTKASRRKVSISPRLAAELETHITNFTGEGPDALLFTAAEGVGRASGIAAGAPLRPSNFRRRIWYPAVEKTVGRPCRPHDLRHTHAALLIQEGAHPKVIQERLGHRSIVTTLDVYGHLFDGLDDEAADSLDARWAAAADLPESRAGAVNIGEVQGSSR